MQTGGNKVTLWDLTTKRPITELQGLGWIRAMTLSPSGGVLAVSRSKESKPPTVEFWDLHSRQAHPHPQPPISRTIPGVFPGRKTAGDVKRSGDRGS